MKIKKLLFLSVFLLPILKGNLHSQDSIPCLFDTILQQQIQANLKLQKELNAMDYGVRYFREENPNLHFYPKPQPEPPCDMCLMMDAGCAPTKYVVPVLVHIVHLTSDNTIGTGSNIPNDHVFQAMETLNKKFSGYNVLDTMAVNTGIQFYLAPVGPNNNGIFRYANNMSNHIGHKDSAVKLLNLIDSQYRYGNYINVFIVNQINNPAVKGYATMYSKDFNQLITFSRKYFGDYGDCSGCDLVSSSNGKTLAHEFGHYLNLYHTFHDSCRGGSASTCDTEGDRCCDIPPVALPNSGCPSTPPNSCAETPVNNPDQIENFMDYTDEVCALWFTRNQAERMHYTLEYLRPALIDIEQLITHDPDICFLSARFKAIKNIACDTGTMVLKAIPFQSSGVIYKWTIYDSTNTLVYSRNDTDKNIFSYYMNTEGFYHVNLQISFDGDTATETINKMLWVTNCAKAIASEQGNWYFGDRAGLVFTEAGTRPSNNAVTSPVTGFSTINSSEGGVSISNGQGELMFYAGGSTNSTNSGQLFNSDHERINSHSSVNLHISGSAVQNTLTFPCPFDTSKMMLLQNNADGVGNFSYSLLKKNTQGKYELDTPSINTNIFISGFNGNNFRIGEYLTAAPKCDGIGHWVAVVATHGTFDSLNTLFILSIDSNGITVADTQFLYLSEYSGGVRILYGFGQAKFSPDATKLALFKYIWDFNRKTGEISNRVEIPDIQTDIYGLTFSPNSRYLFWINVDNDSLFRVDLSHRDIENSIEYIGNSPKKFNSSSMQIGPDNKIYISNPVTDFIGVINFPDIPIAASPNPLGYEPKGAALKIGNSGGTSREGLPNFVDAKKEELVKDTIYYTITDCNKVQFSTTACCRASFKWFFGDGDSSMLRTPELHTYQSYGGYTVTLVLDGVDVISVQVPMNEPTVNILGADTICYYGQQLIYQAQSEFSEQTQYVWTMGNDTLISPPGQPDLAFINIDSVPNTIKVFAYDPIRDCSAFDTLNVIYSVGIENNIINQGKPYFVFNDTDSSDFTVEGSTPSGGDESFIYRWYSSEDSITWTEIVGQSGLHLSNYSIDSVLHIKRIVESELCERPSNIVKAYPITKNNTIGDSSSIVTCGDDSIFISGSIPIDGLGLYRFEWFVSDNGTDWDLIEEESDTTYSFQIIYLNKYYKRVVYSGYDTLNSNTLQVTSGILNNIINNGADTTIIFDYNSNPDLDIIGSEATASGTVSYQWYMSIDSTDWQPISGKTLQDLEFDELQTISWFYRLASISGCNTQSNIVKVFYALLDSNIIGDSAIVVFCPGEELTLTGSLPYGGVNNYQYKWFESANGSTWTLLDGETNQNYAFSGISAIRYFKRRVISGYDSIESNVVQYIPRVRNNLIDAHYLDYMIYYCPGAENTLNVTGASPVIYPSSSPNYQWFYSSDSIDFVSISGQTYQNLNITAGDTTGFLYREVSVDGCVSESTIIKIIPNWEKNQIRYITCYDGSSNLELKGNFSPFIWNPEMQTFGTFYTEWKQSPYSGSSFKLDSIFSSSDSIKAKSADLFASIDSFISFKRYYFTNVSPICNYQSNEIKVYNPEWLNQIELLNGQIAGVREIHTELFDVVWEVSCGGTPWQVVNDPVSNDVLGDSINFSCCDIRRRIIPLDEEGESIECEYLYSNIVQMGEELITEHPQNQIINVGETANFSITYDSPEALSIQWQHYNEDLQEWEDLEDETESNLYVFGDQCNDQSQFRVILTSICKIIIANAATLTVNNPDSDYFLWLKDLPSDSAVEPNSLINDNNYLLSPDIVVSHDPFLSSNTWPYIYSTALYYSGAYIHVIVRNKGTDTSRGGKLFLYASNNNSHPHWDFSFDKNMQTQFVTSWSGNVLNQMGHPTNPSTTVGLGMLINEEGIELPNIPPGGIDTITYHWDNPPANFVVNSINLPIGGLETFEGRRTIIYAARIENCSKSPHNMTYDEVFFPTVQEKSFYQNVKNNARIAAIHSHYLPMKGPRNFSTALAKLPDQWNTIKNDINFPYTVVLNSDSTDHFFSNAEMYVYFDKNLWDAFVLGGYVGSGYTIITDGIFKIDTLVPVYWDNISLPVDSVGHMGYSLHYKPGSVLSGSPVDQLFVVEFHQNSEMVSELFLHTQSEANVEPSAMREDENLSTDPTKHSTFNTQNSFIFSAQPNPFGNELHIYIRGFEQGASVVMYDVNGKVVQSLSEKEDSQTNFTASIPTTHLAEGVYFIRYQSNTQQVVKKVVLVR